MKTDQKAQLDRVVDVSKDPRGAHVLRRLIADAKALDKIAFRLSDRAPWGQDIAAEIRDLVRETGRGC